MVFHSLGANGKAFADDFCRGFLTELVWGQVMFRMIIPSDSFVASGVCSQVICRKFGGKKQAAKIMVILRDFSEIVGHCLGWCHVMTPVVPSPTPQLLVFLFEASPGCNHLQDEEN